MANGNKQILDIGTRVYAEMHKQSGQVIRIVQTGPCGSSPVVEVQLDNGDVRRYVEDDLRLDNASDKQAKPASKRKGRK